MKGTNGKGTWDPMQYFYAILWFAVGLILIFSLSKENKIFLFAGGFFLLLGAGGWADALLPEVDLFAGGWGHRPAVHQRRGPGGAGRHLCAEYRKNGRPPIPQRTRTANNKQDLREGNWEWKPF